MVGKRTLKTARIIISVSRIVTREFKAVGIPEERIVMTLNGVHLEELQSMPNGERFRSRLGVKKDERVVLTIGRPERIRGFQFLIQALPFMMKTIGPTKLLIAGPEFNYGKELKKLARNSGVEDSVIFYGSIEPEEKLGHLQ
jgi:glycosyltransferase involved in cell wall biosynthesis